MASSQAEFRENNLVNLLKSSDDFQGDLDKIITVRRKKEKSPPFF